METIEEWKKISAAYEQLLSYAKELSSYATYLSFEKKRDLERIQEELRALKHGIL